MHFRGGGGGGGGVTGIEIILLQLPGRSASRGGGEGEGREGELYPVSTEGAVIGSGGRLFHSLMVRGKKDSFL